jgi:hypothetical protein
MSQRETNLLWLKDVLDHLRACHQELQWTDNPETVHLLTETMLRDLECCHRLCRALQRRSAFQHAL